jgi:type II secretory ATPase GspE/PulE/Tfp pilus assembly ATPase PilB-like protein
MTISGDGTSSLTTLADDRVDGEPAADRADSAGAPLGIVPPPATNGSGPALSKPAAARPLKFDYLVAQRLISREQLRATVDEAKERGVSVESLLVDQHRLRREDIGISLGLFYRCPFVSLDKATTVSRDLLGNLSRERLRRSGWLPLKRDSGTVTVAMKDPYDLPEVDDIERVFAGEKIKVVVALHDEIVTLIEAAFNDDTRAIINSLTSEDESEAAADDPLSIEESGNDSAIIRLANQIILEAQQRRASDIHIEPYGRRQAAVIRLRIDGTCVDYDRIPGSHWNPLVARFKIMARLDIAERRKPQDGKIQLTLNQKKVELRVATIPTAGGNEDVVLRLLSSGSLIPLESHGLTERNLRELTSIGQKPYGLILCVGPTGSGKTTTLHALLNHVNTPDRKIWTAEDPVEITQPGLRQVQVHPQIGYTFAAAARAFLRADPDVIMIGEMRDAETAAIGVQASLTGHLVLSTLHTNSAAETIIRLLDLGVDPFNFADALLGVLAQRLVKRLCPHCKEPYTASLDEVEELAAAYGPEDFAGLAGGPGTTITLHRPVGCPECNYAGYLGRVPIHELLVASEEIKAGVHGRARVADLAARAKAEGMTTLLQDGVLKVLGGITSLQQVKAVALR